jgi:hypothetical protein
MAWAAEPVRFGPPADVDAVRLDAERGDLVVRHRFTSVALRGGPWSSPGGLGRDFCRAALTRWVGKIGPLGGLYLAMG